MQTENNMLRKNDYHEIDIVELLWKLLYGWRFILVWMVLGAVALGGFKYMQSKGSYESALESQAQTVEDMESLVERMESALEEDDMAQVQEAVKLHTLVEDQQYYQKKSIYMNLNPYAVNKVTMLYMVKEVDEQVVAQYVNAYVSYLSKNAGQSLADAFAQSEDAVYFDELVSVETGIGSKTNDTVLSYVNDDDNTTTYINMNMNMNPNPNNSMFSVTVCGMDSDEAEAMAAVLAGMIEEYRATVNDKVGQHAATLVDTYAYVENDMVMQSYQESQLTLIASNRTSLDTKISDFSDAQQSYYDALITLTQLKSAEETEDVDAGEHGDAVDIAIRTPRISAKYVILGAIAGAFIACVWLVLVFIMSSTFHKIEEVQELYALPVLGQISNMSATKKWLSFVDRWLDSLRYREGMTQEEQMELAVSNISVSLKRDGVNRIFLTSSCHFTDVERSDINAIMDRIRKAGVEVSYGENIMRNVAAFETMASTGHVILVEKPGASRYEEIERELTLCMEQGAGVMGIVGMGC